METGTPHPHPHIRRRSFILCFELWVRLRRGCWCYCSLFDWLIDWFVVVKTVDVNFSCVNNVFRNNGKTGSSGHNLGCPHPIKSSNLLCKVTSECYLVVYNFCQRNRRAFWPQIVLFAIILRTLPAKVTFVNHDVGPQPQMNSRLNRRTWYQVRRTTSPSDNTMGSLYWGQLCNWSFLTRCMVWTDLLERIYHATHLLQLH